MRRALKKLIPLRERRSKKIKLEPYSEFLKTCCLMAELGEPAGRTLPMRQLDQYLWLTGNYLKAPTRSDKTQQREEGSNLMLAAKNSCPVNRPKLRHNRRERSN